MSFSAERLFPVCEVLPRADETECPETLEQFLARSERRAFRIAQYSLGDPEEALDVVQEAMFDLVRAYGMRPPEEWPPLFHRILQNRIRDWQRRNWVRRRWRVWLGGRATEDQESESEDPLQALADGGARNPQDLAALGRSTIALEQALGRLPARQRQAFLLRAWEGLDVAQTARAMGCAQGSVKTHYSRAVHALRASLGDHWDE